MLQVSVLEYTGWLIIVQLNSYVNGTNLHCKSAFFIKHSLFYYFADVLLIAVQIYNCFEFLQKL